MEQVHKNEFRSFTISQTTSVHAHITCYLASNNNRLHGNWKIMLIPFVCTFKTVYKFSDSCKEEFICILTARNLTNVLKVIFFYVWLQVRDKWWKTRVYLNRSGFILVKVYDINKRIKSTDQNICWFWFIHFLFSFFRLSKVLEEQFDANG